MEKRRLGRTDLRIAPMVLGGNVFGWTADKATSFEVLDRFAAAGLNAIDTADAYSSWAPGNKGGESETIIGEWMKARGNRSRMVVVTKVGSPMGKGKEGLSRALYRGGGRGVARAPADRRDRSLPVPFSRHGDAVLGDARRLSKADREGKDPLVRRLQSHHRAARSRDRGRQGARRPRYEVLQPEYNLVDRAGFEGGLADICRREEIGVITYFSLAKGFLSGKYRSPEDLTKSPRGGGVKGYLNPRGFRILDALEDVASRHKARPAEVALAWVIARPEVTAPIASATTIEQADSLIRATELSLSEADMAALNEASAP